MDKEKYLSYKKHRRWGKSAVMSASHLLLVVLTIGATLAYMIAGDGSVKNTFTPSAVSTYVVETLDLESGKKTDVKVQNTGDTTAYIRAAVAVTWQDGDGNVYGQVPIAGTDYEIKYDENSGWKQGADGFYYYLSSVAATGMTGILITECVPVEGRAPAGYSLAVEILSSGIQAEGQDEKGNKPIALAWGVDIDGGELEENVTIKE